MRPIVTLTGVEQCKLLAWNIGGLAARLHDQGFVNYICDFDIVCLTKTFVENLINMDTLFPSFDVYCAPASKLTEQGRMSGGVVVMIKKVLAKFYEVIPTKIDNIICCRFSKDFINSERSLVMIFTYVHPQNSPWYQHAGLNCDITNIDTCISNVLQVYGEVDFMLCGDLNSRTGNSNPCQSHDLDEL